MDGDIRLGGDSYRVDLTSYRVKDILDFAPRASVPGGSIVMSDLGMYQPLVQTDFRRGFGFHWYSDASGYMTTIGDIDTRQSGIAMRYTQKTASDTNNNIKDGFTTFGGYLWSWGAGGLRKFIGSTWSAHSFSGVDVGDIAQASADSTTSLSYKCTVPSSGQNKILVVSLGIRTDVAVTSVKYGGVALTQKTAVGTAPTAELWYLLAPTAGTADVVIVLASATTLESSAVCYMYVDQTTPFGTATTTSGTGTSSSVAVTSAVGYRTIDVITKQGPSTDALTIGASQTYDWTQSIDAGSTGEGGGSFENGAATNTMTWSWTNARLYAALGIALIPASQSVTTQVNFAYATGDYLFYCPDGERIRKISTGLVDSVAGLNSSSTDYAWAIMHNGLIYCAKDGVNRIHYSAEADLSDLEGLDTDTTAIYAGSGNADLGNPIVYATNLYTNRQEGLYHIGDDGIARRVIDYSDSLSTNNFRSMGVVNGFLVFPIRDKLIQWNSVRVNDITPEKINDSFPYTTYGTFDNFVSSDNFLYMTARTNETPYSLDLLCYDGAGFHKLSDLCESTDDVTAMGYDGINNRLWFHINTTSDITYYIQLNENSSFPYANFKLTGQHSLLTSRMDMGFRRVYKSMTSLIVEAENLTADRYINVYYQLEGDGTWYLWDRVDQDGTTNLGLPGGSNTKEFYFMQLRFDLITDSTDQSPILNGYTIRFIMRPDVEFGWNFNIIAATGLRNDEGADDERESQSIVKRIRELRNSKAPIEFIDVVGDTYVGYITSMSEIPTYRQELRDGEPDIEYMVTINFISIGG